MLKLFTNVIKRKSSQDINISKYTTRDPAKTPNASNSHFVVPEEENGDFNVTSEVDSYEKYKLTHTDETTSLTDKAGGTTDRKRPISMRKEKTFSGVFQPERGTIIHSRLYGSPESVTRLSEFLSSNVYQGPLTYLVRKLSAQSDIEVLYPIENVKVGETAKKELQGIDQKQYTTSQNCKDTYENDPVYHTIYSKHIIPSKTSLYRSVLKQVYNDFTILEAQQVSPSGEPTITIKSECLIGADTELRRTGSISNTWHFDFEGKDYRWRPSVLGAKDCDLICEWIEYEVQPSLIGSAKKKNKVIIASLKRPEQLTKDNWDVVGDLTITKTAWENVKEPRSLEIILVLGCLIMLDVS
ncbi:12322_t:CDS:1 [Cetraspora pellucida]|uniref:12322_t:CDS:1 n=1 Tax=Cetraspora pellucida TaxID=1433469 RepID=A0A9N9NEN1_9GLOM|nr:12322_t:CDS:1 [Cetraspora pellucida]